MQNSLALIAASILTASVACASNLVSDTFGPLMLGTEVRTADPGPFIDLFFDEAVMASSINTNNLRLVRPKTQGDQSVYVPISAILTSGRTARLRLAGPIDSDYYLLANGVSDTRGNQIAPNSVLAVPNFVPSVLPTNGPADALRLTVTRTGNAYELSWPNGYYGYHLEMSTELGADPVWTGVANQSNPYSFPAEGGQRYFRLRQGINTGR